MAADPLPPPRPPSTFSGKHAVLEVIAQVSCSFPKCKGAKAERQKIKVEFFVSAYGMTGMLLTKQRNS